MVSKSEGITLKILSITTLLIYRSFLLRGYIERRSYIVPFLELQHPKTDSIGSAIISFTRGALPDNVIIYTVKRNVRTYGIIT